MFQPFQVDFCFNFANLLLVVVLVKLPGSMCCTGFFWRSSSILNLVVVDCLMKKFDVVFNLLK